MEVHHHSHSARKKWTHYLWEFFMLFLAVTAGFLVENWREHFVEHKRAKAFAASLIEDLKKDTAALNQALEFSGTKNKGLDRLVELLHQSPDKWHDSVFYDAVQYFPRIAPFVHTQGTYEQIKNSGSLRYFPQRLVGLLNQYDVYSKRAEDRDALNSKQVLETFIPFSSGFINYEVILDFISHRPVSHSMYNKMKGRDEADQFINYAVMARRGQERSLSEYEQLMKLSGEIFKELKEKYHLQ
ncbi:MAG: hypothetical protein HZB42_12375 [Sphingobacteriales bacterium]|nr:hypothetical protein [Sphingobacteriales bacterium]